MARPTFAQVMTSLWRDRDFLALPTDARLLFLWSWTHDGAGVAGLYTASVLDLMLALESPPRSERLIWEATTGNRVRAALAQLLTPKPMLLYDTDHEVLWVVNRARYANKSPRAAQLMRDEYERVPACPLRDEFSRRYWRELGLANNYGGTP